MNALSNDWISRFTLSGGDPMYQSNRKEVIELCKEIRERFPRMEIWLYTGYKYEEVKADETMSPILKVIDVLVDGEFVEELKDQTLPFRGSSNQRIIEVK